MPQSPRSSPAASPPSASPSTASFRQNPASAGQFWNSCEQRSPPLHPRMQTHHPHAHLLRNPAPHSRSAHRHRRAPSARHTASRSPASSPNSTKSSSAAPSPKSSPHSSSVPPSAANSSSCSTAPSPPPPRSPHNNPSPTKSHNLIRSGLSEKDALKQVAKSRNLGKSEAYREYQRTKR